MENAPKLRIANPSDVIPQSDGKKPTTPADDRLAEKLAAELDQNGIVVLPPLFSPEQLRDMRKAFETRLHGIRWNDLDGYEKEPLRRVVQDVLTVEQGFVDLAVHPLVT